MTDSKASSLVAQAKTWATYYGDFTQGEAGSVLTAPLKMRAAWDRNDAAGVADSFAEIGSMLVGDRQLRGRQEIRDYVGEAFDGGWSGTKLVEEPEQIRFITDDVAVAITRGGILPADQDELTPEQVVRATYVVVRTNGDWQLASHQSSPIKG